MDQAEGVIKFAVGIRKTREVGEMIRREKLGGAFFGSEMDEG